MLARRIIPCLDVDAGRVKKGVRFVELRDAGDPVEVAAEYDRQGADEICFLDITASSDGRATMLDVVRTTAERVFLPLTVGGGVRSVENVRELLLAGADKAGINTAAVHDPELVRRVADAFGSQALVVAVDARRCPDRPGNWEVFTHGGRKGTDLDAVAWCVRMAELGAGEILLTSMGSCTAAVLMPALSAPAKSSARTSSTLRTPPPTVSGRNTRSAVMRTTSIMVLRPSEEAVMSRKQISSAPWRSYSVATSTGSPASRSSTKRTPFFTRPASTSRQGMIRRASISPPAPPRPAPPRW